MEGPNGYGNYSSVQFIYVSVFMLAYEVEVLITLIQDLPRVLPKHQTICSKRHKSLASFRRPRSARCVSCWLTQRSMRLRACSNRLYSAKGHEWRTTECANALCKLRSKASLRKYTTDAKYNKTNVPWASPVRNQYSFRGWDSPQFKPKTSPNEK